MRTLSCAVLVAAALLGCARPSSDTAGSPKLQTAVVAAGLALSTINRCLLQIERARNTAVPECDAAEDAETRQAPRVAVATAVYPLVARSQWQAH